MATFNYTAINKEGKRESATIEAVSSIAAGHLLKAQGLMPVDLVEHKEPFFKTLMQSVGSVSLKEKLVFIEDLNIMIKSGIPAPRALNILAHQTKNAKFKKIVSDLSRSVEAGKSLHEAMAKYPKVFSYLFTSMIKVGEMSGNLEKSLEYLAIQLEREADLKSKTKGAMIYPAVILSAMVIIGIVMAIFVLPKLTSVFKEFNGTLPLSTRIVIGISDFMSGNILLVGVVLLAVIIGFIVMIKTKQGQRLMDAVLLRLPVISPIVKKINLARFARIMSSMLKSGITIVEGLEVTSEAVGNIYYRELIAQAAKSVRLGKPLTEVLATNEKLFPYIIQQMLEVGEETGSVDSILEQLAIHFEAEVDATMRNLSSIIEPVLLLVIGGVVGVLAVALIGPIYNISQNVQ